MAQQQWQGYGQPGQQHDVQRQRIHQVGLEAQQQFIGQRLLGIGDEMRQAHFLDQVAGLHMAVGVEDDAHQHRQQEDMHHIQHPGASEDLHTGDQVAVALKDFAVGQYCRVAGKEDENLRSIAETDVAQGDLAQRVVRDVIPEDEDQRQAPKEIDARVASVKHGSGLLNS
ncbi:hypothetical protein D3C76_1030900 [compost metagenome]